MSAASPAVSADEKPAPPQQQQQQERPRDKTALLRHPRLRRVLAILTLTLGALFATWWFFSRPFISTDDARVAAPVVMVAPQGPGGRVERVLVREGQEVQAGEALVELEAIAERAQVDRARALLKLTEARIGEAEAQLELERRLSEAAERRAHANVRSAQAVLQRTVSGARAEEKSRARADVAAAETLAAQAKRDLERAEALSHDGSIAPAALETARTTEASARASLDARKAALELLEHGARPEDVSISRGGVLLAEAGLVEADAGSDRVVLRTRQVEEARAQAAQSRAELALAELTLSRMTLKSSAAGTVIRVSVDPGDNLAPGQGAVTVVDLAHAWIAANVEETKTGLLHPGQPVHISIDEGGELNGRLEVVTKSAASQFALIPADNAAGNFTKVVQRIPVRIAIDESAALSSLRVGQSVEVRIRVR